MVAKMKIGESPWEVNGMLTQLKIVVPPAAPGACADAVMVCSLDTQPFTGRSANSKAVVCLAYSYNKALTKYGMVLDTVDKKMTMGSLTGCLQSLV